MHNSGKAMIAIALMALVTASLSAEPGFNAYLGGGYAFVLPETHGILAELDLYLITELPKAKVEALWAITVDLRFLAYEDGFSGAVCLGTSVFFKPYGFDHFEEAYFRAGIVPMEEIAFYGELGYAWHFGWFALNAGVGFFADSAAFKATVGIFL
jgi:hypothetical protein